MKISSKCAVAALALISAAGAVSAQTVNFTSGIREAGFNGGEFIGNYTGGPLDGLSIRGFCIELNEQIALGGTNYFYEVVSGADGAVNGGGAGGNPDPLSNATAAVFSAWMSGAIANTPANATLVQRAIWYLEGESGTNAAVNALIAAFGGGYDATPNANDFNPALFPNIRIVNPWSVNGDGSLTQRQSQIILIPLPTASGMALAGLALVGGIRRRK